ncbi:unnamed protein product [Rotaria magnacalcarata]|uniref:Uncharacterized protein n=2 Tax=Rotaria magnacalcarata TaxID=392030 RepID=A0A816AL07_9BILA|nr:unnamed protein product [Rotaria magnacalcarata]CAF1596314.1 unnamed protein product [Rotaria magnacalcarata]CAF2110513.1 unnamed protein product [Rotaria magnacalcarata]CAF3819860.1 unnamed protein product [Rotaria magnacalcarata]CAF4093482.1 unnamed protein product [Rotaria magnacalcarata]
MPYNSPEAKRQILTECRSYYRGRPREMAAIEEFRCNYRSQDAIYWYTKPCFLHYLINRVLRTGDIMALYKFRYFIVDMCTHLEEMAETTRAKYRSPFRVYRGATLGRDEVEQLKIGMVVATKEFFSSSRHLNIAEKFIGIDETTGISPSQSREDKKQFVLLETSIDWRNSPTLIVADVSSQSAIPDECEMIFELGTTFAITDITYDGEHRVWHVQLIVSSEAAQIKDAYNAYIRKRLTEIKPILLFGKVLVDMSSDTIRALTYFHRLLRIVAKDDEDRPNLYFHVARIYRYMGKYQEAVTYYRCAQLLQRRKLPESSFDYARTLSDLGLLHNLIGNAARAIVLHTRAMMILRTILPEDHIEIGHISHELALDYLQEKQYDRALLLVSNSLSFFQRKMPANHPGQAQALRAMGLIQRALGHREEAISCFKQALRIRELLQATNAPAVAYECYELSLVYAENEDEHNVAFEYAQRAFNICRQKLHPNHIRSKRIVQHFEHLSRQLNG